MLHLPHLDVGSGRQRGALTLFPVWIETPSIRGVEWSASGLDVRELPDGPSVERLLVANPASRPCVLLEGDLLVGGLQHRMAATSVLVPAEEAVPVAVRCVEHGRWSGDPVHRADGGRATYSVRQENLVRGQAAVWSRIARYDRELGMSATSSMIDHLGRGAEPVRRMSGQRGVIVGIGGRVIGMELFGSGRGLAARWEGIVAAAALDAALAPPVGTPAQAARDLVRALGRTRLAEAESSGAARAIRSDRGPLRVSGACSGDALLHLTAFDDHHPLLAAA